MNRTALIAEWQREEVEPFAGWDFSHLAGRRIEEPPPWSYAERVRGLMHGATSVLDLGTGGGERLLGLQEQLEAGVKLAFGVRLYILAARK